MMVKAPSLASSLMPSSGSTQGSSSATPDSAQAFAAMMAGIGQPAPTRANPGAAAPTNDDDPKDAVAKKDGKDDKDDRADDGDADTGADALLAMTAGTAAAPVATTPASIVVAMPMSNDPQTASNGPASSKATKTGTGGGLGTMPAADAASGTTPAAPTPAPAAASATLQALATSPVTVAPVAEQSVATTTASAAAAGKATRTPRSAAAALPAVSTADILASRSGTRATSVADADKADDPADGEDAASADLPVTLAGTTQVLTPAVQPVSTGIAAGQTLAATGADRQLDLAKEGAWLDGLARDIASTADAGGTLRFQLSPQHLGKLDVQVQRGDEGTAVTLTTATDAAQAILSDAKPKLIAEARAHGVHISDARVDLAAAGTSADTSGQKQQQSADSRPDAGTLYRDSGTSSNAGGSTGNGHADTRQPVPPENLYRTMRTSVPSAKETTTGSSPAADERYA